VVVAMIVASIYVIAPTAIEADVPMLDRVLAAGYPFVFFVAATRSWSAPWCLPSGSLPVAEPADLG